MNECCCVNCSAPFPVSFLSLWVRSFRIIHSCRDVQNCVLMLPLSPQSIVLPLTAVMYKQCTVCFFCCVLFMHEWVMVTGLLMRQALWHYDRMRSPHCWMTRSPCQPLLLAHTHIHTHLTMSLNKSAWIMVMPLAVKHCPTLRKAHINTKGAYIYKKTVIWLCVSPRWLTSPYEYFYFSATVNKFYVVRRVIRRDFDYFWLKVHLFKSYLMYSSGGSVLFPIWLIHTRATINWKAQGMPEMCGKD